MSEYRLKIGVFVGTGSVWPKMSGTMGRLSATILLVGKLDECAFYMV